MTSEAIRSKEINETGINKNETSRFDQDVQEKPHDDDMENKSSSIPERTTKPLEKSQHSSIPFPNRVRNEEALQRNFLKNLKQLDISIPFIEVLLQIPKYAKYLKSLQTNKSRLEKAYTKTMNERCLAVLLNELPLKEKDPTSFTIPCQVLEKQKEAENLAADHSSRLENPHMKGLTKREIADKFSDEHLMVLKSKFKDDEPWYADFINYIVGKDANEYVRRCDACQRSGNISSRNEMPQNNIQWLADEECNRFKKLGLRSDDKIPPPTQQAPHTVSTIKFPILTKDEYDIWAMKMEHYLSHIDYPIWEVIQKGNGPVTVSTDTNGVIKMIDAKDMWDAIKSRFGGNDESKKMQKYILKQYKLEIHGASVSTEDVNQKFLKSLPSSWSQVSLVMRTKPGVDNLSIDNFYNNIRVFESDIKGSTRSSSRAKNVAFVSSESTSSTNDVSTANGVSTSFGCNS
ncbi:hypothetical protein Tco_1172691 [Tanacetum coccineum]